jgi:MoaA/NifB/PqqE/SkfB family radical SAM enzyme
MSYRINVNWEWTSKCNASCAMCPRTLIDDPQVMSRVSFEQALARLDGSDVYRCIVAGYGEPTTHPEFDRFVDMLRGHPVAFDIATNGSRLDEARLRHLDGVFDRLMISFSSIDPGVYARTHTRLAQSRVLENILAAHRLLKKTRLVINLSPTKECLDTLEGTLSWFRHHGIDDLHMSPTYYDRAGAMQDRDGPDHRRLRDAIRRHRLKSQEQAFISGVGDFVRAWQRNDFKCVPRNISLMISAAGRYTYCFNDITHSRSLGHVATQSIREALERREQSPPEPTLCAVCNLNGRYGPRELLRVAWGYAQARLAPAAA